MTAVTEIVEIDNRLFVGIQTQSEDGLLSDAVVSIIEYDAPGGNYDIKGYIKLPPGFIIVNSMLPVFDGKFLLCTHDDSTITLLDTNTLKFKVVKPSPFGPMDGEIKVIGVTLLEKKILFKAFETIAFNTDCGLFLCTIYEDGHIERYEEPIFLPDTAVTSVNVIHGDDLFINYQSRIPFQKEEEQFQSSTDLVNPTLAERKTLTMKKHKKNIVRKLTNKQKHEDEMESSDSIEFSESEKNESEEEDLYQETSIIASIKNSIDAKTDENVQTIMDQK